MPVSFTSTSSSRERKSASTATALMALAPPALPGLTVSPTSESFWVTVPVKGARRTMFSRVASW